MRFIVLDLREGKDKRKRKSLVFGLNELSVSCISPFLHTHLRRGLLLEVFKRWLEVLSKHVLEGVTSAEEIASALEPFPLSSLDLLSTHV